MSGNSAYIQNEGLDLFLVSVLSNYKVATLNMILPNKYVSCVML